MRTIEIEKVTGGGGDTGSRVDELNALYDQNVPREVDETPELNLERDREDGYTNHSKTNIDISKFNFNRYLRSNIGDPPLDMVDPHAHHILFKEGNGSAQKALVEEGQALLRKYEIDPLFGLENLVWAPNRIAGQHDYAALKNVVDQLKLVEKFGGSHESIRENIYRYSKGFRRVSCKEEVKTMTDNDLLIGILDSIKRNNVESFYMLLNSNLDCLNEITPFGTWLHVAASKGRLEIVKTLVEKGIDINKCGGVFGGSAINEGASKGHYDIVNYLLLCGAKLDTSEPERNPLFGAIMSGNKEIVQLLLDHGIDASVKYTGDYMKNMDAYDFAIERGQKEIAEMLKPYRK